MSAREDVLKGLQAASDGLAELIAGWRPSPNAAPGELMALEERKRRIEGQINEVIAATFKGVASPELLAAMKDLSSVTAGLEKFGKTVAEVNGAIKVADEILAATAKVVKVVAAA